MQNIKLQNQLLVFGNVISTIEMEFYTVSLIGYNYSITQWLQLNKILSLELPVVCSILYLQSALYMLWKFLSGVMFLILESPELI